MATERVVSTMDDLLLNKKVSVERAIAQARRYYEMPSTLPFEEDYLKQDAIAINLQRACEQCIDIANYLIRINKLGLVKSSGDSFVVLAKEGVIDAALAQKLVGMVGFRNTLVHQYQQLDLSLLQQVVVHHLDDLLRFTTVVMQKGV